MPFITKKTSLPSALNNQLPAFISYFAGGMIFAFYGEKLLSKLKIAFLPCLALLVLLNVFKIPFVSALLVPICLSFCVMFLGLNLKVFADIGRKTDYSYSLYLVHYPLAIIIPPSKKNHTILFIVLISFIASYLCTNLPSSTASLSSNV